MGDGGTVGTVGTVGTAGTVIGNIPPPPPIIPHPHLSHQVVNWQISRQWDEPVYELQANMMNSNPVFVVKVLLASGVISLAIVSGGPALNIPATSSIALTLVLLPPLLMAGILGFRAWQQD